MGIVKGVDRCRRRRPGQGLGLRLVVLALAVVLVGAPLAARRNPILVWYAPDPGSLDMLHLFEDPGQWPTALARMSIFKFYQGHVLPDPPGYYGSNTYDALRAVDAFRTVTERWHKRIAIEVGVVKDQFCTADASGMNHAILDTLRAIEAVHAAGGEVSYLAMDDPFAGGLTAACGGGDTTQTLARLQRYFAKVKFAAPNVQIGLIEPYPTFSSTQLLDYVHQMSNRGIRPAFFHLDADLWQLRKTTDTYAQDVQTLEAGLAADWVPFGVIFWGHSGDSDALYYQDALQLIHRRSDAVADDLPAHVIFQSWAESKTGARITPTNLPESGPNTHTALILAGMQLLRRPVGQ